MMSQMAGGRSPKDNRRAAVHRALAGAGLASLLAVSACGTTVPLTQSGGDPRSATDATFGLGQGPPGASNATPGAQAPNSRSSSNAGGGTIPGSAGGVPSGTSGTGTTGVGSASSAFQGRGVTSKTLTIGIAIAGGTSALANSLGVSGAGTVATQDMMNAAVVDVNKSGGVLGRKLQVVVHNFDAARAISNPSQTFAEICTDFRDDHKVFAVLFDVPDPSLRKCLAEMGSPLLVLNSYSILPATAYAEHGGSFIYGPNSITTDRLAQLFIKSLMDRTFTQKWNTTTGGPGVAPVKLGVIHVDTPDQNALYAGYAKELAKYGLKFSDTVTYAQDASTALSATQAAVLKFSADGVTHVFGASAFFLRDAESQSYRPRYAYLPGLGSLGVDNSPAAQLKGALTVGWTPTSDVKASEDPGDTSGAAHCRAVMKSANLSTANRTDLVTMYSVCDAVFSLRTALVAGAVPTVPGLRRGYEALGTTFGTALSFVASLGPNRHYGVDAVRDMAFDSTCSCLKYTSRTNRS